ncbi:MAG: hypothetical protein GY782_08905 [Gammaproteobacteria bacterium]|nr:hypothetical protein [Gammaproteobacteria bacterium]
MEYCSYAVHDSSPWSTAATLCMAAACVDHAMRRISRAASTAPSCYHEHQCDTLCYAASCDTRAFASALLMQHATHSVSLQH